MSYTTKAPGAPTGFTYTGSFRDPANPSGDPPSLRRLVIGAPTGAILDTAAVTRCKADDETLKQEGEAACPPGSKLGGGSAVVKPLLLPEVSYETTLFNADHDQLELLEGDPPSPPVVVHGYIHDRVVDSRIPTCLNGGFAPDDCPDDQVALRSNTLSAPAISSGSGAKRRSYLKTPPTCPKSGLWRSPVTFYYGDGAVETLVTTQPCKRRKGARLRLAAEASEPEAGAVPVVVRVRDRDDAGGTPTAHGVRALLHRVRAGGRVDRTVLGRSGKAVVVHGKRRLSIGLPSSGLEAGRYVVRVRGRDARGDADRFSVP